MENTSHESGHQTTVNTSTIEILPKNNHQLRQDIKKISHDEICQRITSLNNRITELEDENKKLFKANEYKCQEITEQEKKRKEIKHKKDNKDKLDSLGILAGGIAHKFNNLFACIFGYIEIAQDNINDGHLDQAQIALHLSLSTFKNAKSLTNKLITFSSGGNPCKKVQCMESIIKSCICKSYQNANFLYNVNIDPNLHPCNCDEEQISQVINELIINAHDSITNNGIIDIIAKNITIEEDSLNNKYNNNHFIKISITDYGCGIPEEIHSQIFDPFFTIKKGHQGLGLSIIRSIVNKHNGWIDFHSQTKEGSTFNLYLQALPVETANKKSIITTDPSCKGTVLIMDDEEFIIDIEKQILQRAGYSVITAKDGKEALAKYRNAIKNRVDILFSILDLTIPEGIGGKDTAKAILEQNKDAVLYVSSGYSKDPIMEDPKKYGFKGKINKPFKKQSLLDLIEEY